jgi:hypothetical protein
MSLHSNKFLLVAILFSSVAFVSCKKDDAQQPLQSGLYISDKEGDIGSVRLFTKLGEVKDQHLINTYKVKFATQLAVASGAGTDSLLVIDESNAKIGSRNYAISKVDNYYQFSSVDTLTFFGQLDPVYYNVIKYKPYYLSTPIPSSTGFNYRSTTLQYYYASTTSGGLTFPIFNMVRFATTTNPGGLIPVNTFYNAYTINNVFDDKFSVNTLNYDTLLVQTYNAFYKKLNP